MPGKIMTAAELKKLGFTLRGRLKVTAGEIEFASGHGLEWTIHWKPKFMAAQQGEFEQDYSADELRVEFGNQEPPTPAGRLF